MQEGHVSEGTYNPQWEETEKQIDVAALSSKEPILFYDEVNTLWV